MLTTNKLLQKGSNPIISIFLLTCPPPLHPGCPAIPGLSQHHLAIAIPTIALHTQCLFFSILDSMFDFEAKHQTVCTAVCNLCTLLNGEGWTRAHFSLTVFHLSESAPWQVYIFLISIWILTRDLRKRTWGGEFLGPGLDNRGELDWGLPHTPASAILFEEKTKEPQPVILGWQRQPPYPQLQDNKPLETAVDWGMEKTFESLWKPH